ncbi:hypothetical protein C3492_10305 [Streptomyces sp. Ru62]|nr:hypothetical protein C3492_10305 [Streptomyces sp. Ru62]
MIAYAVPADASNTCDAVRRGPGARPVGPSSAARRTRCSAPGTVFRRRFGTNAPWNPAAESPGD